MMKPFIEFVDRKQRTAKKHLGLVEKLLHKGGLEVKSFLEEDDPYIFVKNPNKNLSFDGIRIYQIGDILAYRIQRRMETHPYGKAYELNLEEMYNDFMSEFSDEEKSGRKVIESCIHEIKTFFDKSVNAERENQGSDPLNNLVMKAGGTDYSSLVMSQIP